MKTKKKTITLGAVVMIVIMIIGGCLLQHNSHNNDSSIEQTTETVQNNIRAVVVNKPEVVVGSASEDAAVQQVAVLWKDDIGKIGSASLIYTDNDGNERTMTEEKRIEDAILFTEDMSEASAGEYTLAGIRYNIEGSTEEQFLSLKSIEMNATFSVAQETSDEVADTGDTSIKITDVSDTENIDCVVSQGVENALQNSSAMLGSDGNIVIVLDPGHGGTDSGASYYGLLEKDLNLKIATACMNELKQYNGVEVYMTRYDDTTHTSSQIMEIANSYNPDLLVSIHNNAGGGTGAEVWYPNANYRPAMNVIGAGVSQQIQNQLCALGLYNRGIKTRDEDDTSLSTYLYPDGSISDWYFINRESKKAGYTGIIVEHAYLDNYSDVCNFLNSDDKLEKLGVADATGIANYYGLTKTIPGEIAYKTHVQTYGWQSYVSDSEISGTTGEAKRLEGICIQFGEEFEEQGISGSVQYKTHIQTYGWESDWKSDGEISGTTGESKRLEAIQIQLTGEAAEKYDVYYRVHAQTYGWLGWAKNGQSAGTAGYSKRLEAIQIVLVEKGGSAPGSTENHYYDKDCGAGNITYSTHVQTYGWQDYVSDGEVAGTTGEGKRLEGIYIKKGLGAQEAGESGGIEYRTHIQTYGWEEDWNSEGQMSGTSGESKRLEAIQIRLTGDWADKYDVYYRVHAQTFGWMDWAVNGQSAGTAGFAKRLEAIQIVLVEKGGSAPGSTDVPFRDKDDLYSITGTSSVSATQLANYFTGMGKSYPEFYQNDPSGATTLERFCEIYVEEAAAEGIRAEVAFCQAMKETGWLNYGGQVKQNQYNFAGLGATDGGASGATFSNVREGIRAQIQHLKAYANTESLNNACVDPRFGYVTRGCAPYVEWLGQQENPNGKGWATAKNYGYDIVDMINSIYE